MIWRERGSFRMSRKRLQDADDEEVPGAKRKREDALRDEDEMEDDEEEDLEMSQINTQDEKNSRIGTEIGVSQRIKEIVSCRLSAPHSPPRFCS